MTRLSIRDLTVCASFLIERVKNILIRPQSEWPLIASESGQPVALLPYVALLAAIPAIANFIGISFVGVAVSIGTFHEPLLSGALKAIVSYLFSFAIVALTALAIHALAPLFGAVRYFPNALKLAVYSFTPVWLIGIVLAIPGLRFLTILGLYALRLVWTGLPPLMGAPRRKVLAYAIVIVVVAFIIVFAMAVVQALINALFFQR